jgi:hypothetical protein
MFGIFVDDVWSMCGTCLAKQVQDERIQDMFRECSKDV